MALNPSIALQVQPPAIPQIQIQDPLQRYAQVQSLRGMMQQAQLRDLQMQEAQREAQAEQRLRDLYPTGTEQPTFGQFVQAGGVKGAQLFKSVEDAKTAELARKKSALDYDQGLVNQRREKVKDFNSTLQGIVDNQSRAAAFAKAVTNGWATTEELQPYQNLEVTDPKFQAFLRGHINNGLTAEQYLDQTSKRIEEEKKKLDLGTGYKLADASTLAAAAEQGPEQLAAAMANLPQERRGLFVGATTPIDIMKRAQTPQEFIQGAEAERHNKAVEEYTRSGQTATQAHQLATSEASLRQDYLQTSKAFQAVTDAYGRIKQASKGPASGASDIALLYGYMKILDPNSAVREGEFATAQNAGGIPDKVRALWNGLLTGDRLSPNVRSEMVGQTENLYAQALQDHNKVAAQYADTATRQKLNPKNVVLDFESTLKSGGPQPSATYNGQAAPAGKIWVKRPDGNISLIDADKWEQAQKKGYTLP